MTTHTNDPRLLTLADGVAITPANTAAGGRPADAVPLAGTGAATVETDYGPRVYRFGGPATGDIARWDWTGADAPAMALEALFRVSSYPTSGDDRCLGIRNATGYAASVDIRVDGTLRLFNAAGTSVFTTAGQVPLGAPFRVYLGAEKGAGASDGELHFAYYTASDGQSTTPAETYDSSTANTGTANYTIARYGKTSTNGVLTTNVGYLRMSDSQFTAIGPLTTAPSITGYADVVGADLTGFIVGGSAPWSVVSATQVAGTSVGTVHVDGLAVWVARPTVDAATIRVVVEDASGVDSAAYDVVFPVGGGAGGGLRVWDGAAWT